jgi:hypothetical protein
MRVFVFLLSWVVVLITCHAQNRVDMNYYQGSEMVDRWNSATKKAIAATQPDMTGSRKRKKPDPLLTNQYQGKTFEGGGGNFDKKLSGQKEFLYDQKTTAANTVATRSFFGLKNPWFGKKVMDTGKASLWSKTAVANADKKYPLEGVETRGYYQAEKKALGRTEAVPTRQAEVSAKAQGVVESVSQSSNLTIEQVRELLNKR